MAEDYNNRAAKGQAYNLAIADALKAGQQENAMYIYKKYVYYYELGQLLQDSSIQDIKEILDEAR